MYKCVYGYGDTVTYSVLQCVAVYCVAIAPSFAWGDDFLQIIMYYTQVHAVCMYLQKSYPRNTTEPTALQLAATPHCNMLQHNCCNTTATQPSQPHPSSWPHSNTLQHTVIHCNTLQHTATHRNTLHHTATHCNTLQYTATQPHPTSWPCEGKADV